MDLQRKTIQNLTATLDEKRENLSVFYRQFGEKLLKDSSEINAAGAVPAERVALWRGLMTSRALDNQLILDIKAAIVRQQELGNFRKEIDRTLAGEKTSRREQIEKLGSMLYKAYDPDRDEEDFGPTWSNASKEASLIAGLEEKQAQLRSELESSGFFGKMFAQFKMAGFASNIRQHRARMSKILVDGTTALVDSGELEKKYRTGFGGPEMDAVYAKIHESGERLEELENRNASLEADLGAVRDTLAACNASENPGRRAEELRFGIRETDKRIDNLAVLCAREYSDKFLDEDGRSVLGDTGDGNTFSDMGAYAHQLEQIAQFRTSISTIRRRIQVLEMTLRIESIDKNIAGYERTIVDYGKKIEHLRQLTEDLRRSIDDASAERVELVGRRDEIGETLKGSADTDEA